MSAPAKPTHSKPRLGRGLSSLISTLSSQQTTAAAYEAAHPDASQPTRPVIHTRAQTRQSIPLDDIAPNPYQPRQQFPEEDLAELANSIARHGMLQPVLVSQATDPGLTKGYVLVAGERRLRAAHIAGLREVPCILCAPSQEQMLEWAVIENIHRADLNPVERAAAYRRCMDRFGLSQAELAEHLGEPRATVANYMRILDLDPDVLSMVAGGSVSFGHAKVLAGLLSQPQRQVELGREVVQSGLSVRDLERLVAEGQTGSGSRPPEASRRRDRPAYLMDVEERLTAAVGTRVLVMPRRAKNTGRIVIEYYSLDDFDRIAERLGLKADEPVV